MSKKLSSYIPEGLKPWPHELRAAKVLASAGYKVEFIMPRQNLPTADILLDGIEYEMKSPESFNPNAIEHLIRAAIRQSPHIIIDTSRLKKIPQHQVLRSLKRQIYKNSRIKRFLVITKRGDIIDIM